MKKWKIVASNTSCIEGKDVVIKWAKDKYWAGMEYNLLKARYNNVWVFDPDGEFCDPCEL